MDLGTRSCIKEWAPDFLKGVQLNSNEASLPLLGRQNEAFVTVKDVWQVQLYFHSEMEIIKDLELDAALCISSGWNFESQACHSIETNGVIRSDMLSGTGKVWSQRTLFACAKICLSIKWAFTFNPGADTFLQVNFNLWALWILLWVKKLNYFDIALPW